MTTATLDSFVAVPVSVELYAELARRQPRGVSSLLERVAWDFINQTANDLDPVPRGRAGVQWESLFLPEGTELRTKYFDELKVAVIRGNQISWDGRAYPSMSQLARAMRGDTSNNAWKVLEVKRPSDASWRLADFLRR